MNARLALTLVIILLAASVSSSEAARGRRPAPRLEGQEAAFMVPAIAPPGAPSLATTPWPVYKVNQFVTAQPQNEPSIAINRTDPLNVVAAWRDFRLGSSPAIRRVAIGRSFDGGATWVEGLFTDAHGWDRQSDPSVASDCDGVLYACILSYLNANQANEALVVTRSLDGGQSWSAAVDAVRAANGDFEDRQIMTADDTPASPFANRVYVSWSRFPGNGGDPYIMAVASADRGGTWSAPALVSDVPNTQGSMPATGPDGELYVVWEDFNQPAILIDRSDDGGLTWGTDVKVADVWYLPVFPDGIFLFEYPTVAVDCSNGPYRGRVYVSWAMENAGDADLFVAYSDDEGGTWSAPIRVNDDPVGNGREQYMQWIACGIDGRVHIVFADRRHSADDIMTDEYLAQSSDGGLTWTNTRLTDVSFDPRVNYNSAVRFGDYVGIDALGAKVMPIWTDSHLGNQDVFTANIVTGPLAAGSTSPPPAVLAAAPNPAGGFAAITYTVREAGRVRLDLFDLRGRLVRRVVDRDESEGRRTVGVPTGDLPAGVYLVRLAAGGGRAHEKLVVAR